MDRQDCDDLNPSFPWDSDPVREDPRVPRDRDPDLRLEGGGTGVGPLPDTRQKEHEW